MKLFFLLCMLFFVDINLNAQAFNDNKISMINFIKRMYNTAPFEGVKIIEDYDNKFLISIHSYEINKYNNPSLLSKLSRVKAQSSISNFVNGSRTESDIIIKTINSLPTDSSNVSVTIIESIRERSLGFINSIELLNSFETSEGKKIVFIYYKQL